MTKIKATEKRTLAVAAPITDVYNFFLDPMKISKLTADLEKFELLDPHRARWMLVEKVEKGVRYAADYTVEYSGNGQDEVTWQSVEGNMDIDGKIALRSLENGHTELDYQETVAPDLPITRLTAIIFKPIVARELRQDISGFLDRVTEHFGPSES